MRVPFLQPSLSHFERLFIPVHSGGSLSDIRIYSQKRGGGILSFIAGLARKAVPFLMRTILPEGVNMTQNVLQDINTGQNIKTALKQRGIASLKTIGQKLTGGSRIRTKRLQNNNKKNTKKRKSCFKDIFKSL